MSVQNNKIISGIDSYCDSLHFVPLAGLTNIKKERINAPNTNHLKLYENHKEFKKYIYSFISPNSIIKYYVNSLNMLSQIYLLTRAGGCDFYL